MKTFEQLDEQQKLLAVDKVLNSKLASLAMGTLVMTGDLQTRISSVKAEFKTSAMWSATKVKNAIYEACPELRTMAEDDAKECFYLEEGERAIKCIA